MRHTFPSLPDSISPHSPYLSILLSPLFSAPCLHLRLSHESFPTASARRKNTHQVQVPLLHPRNFPVELHKTSHRNHCDACRKELGKGPSSFRFGPVQHISILPPISPCNGIVFVVKRSWFIIYHRYILYCSSNGPRFTHLNALVTFHFHRPSF